MAAVTIDGDHFLASEGIHGLLKKVEAKGRVIYVRNSCE
jgi:hypothetical protein